MLRIEQYPDEVRLSFEFQVNSEISAIRLTSAAITRMPDSPLQEGNAALTSGVAFRPTELRHSVAVGAEVQVLTFAVDFDFHIASGDDLTDELAKVQCRFEADYLLRPGFEPSEEQTRAFHSGNAIFNCWPYFREFIQSATVRMGLPAATVPFLRLVPRTDNNLSEGKPADALSPPVGKPAKQLAAPAKSKSKKSK